MYVCKNHMQLYLEITQCYIIQKIKINKTLGPLETKDGSFDIYVTRSRQPKNSKCPLRAFQAPNTRSAHYPQYSDEMLSIGVKT